MSWFRPPLVSTAVVSTNTFTVRCVRCLRCVRGVHWGGGAIGLRASRALCVRTYRAYVRIVYLVCTCAHVFAPWRVQRMLRVRTVELHLRTYVRTHVRVIYVHCPNWASFVCTYVRSAHTYARAYAMCPRGA